MRLELRTTYHINHCDIAQKAHQIWKQNKDAGIERTAEEDWLEAENELRKQFSS